jgi:phosphate transport system protein
MTTPRHFDLELAELKRTLAGMGDLVCQALRHGADCIQDPRVAARDEARPFEERIDALHVQIEERCHQIIALHAPIASDLRLLISALRIASDLEQIGDLAESSCKRASFIARHQRVHNPPDLLALGALVVEMARHALDAFLAADLARARQVLTEEERSDDLTKRCYKAIQAAMCEFPSQIQEYTHLLRAVGLLEHAGDIAVSIAEEAVYVHQGRLIRHKHDEM